MLSVSRIPQEKYMYDIDLLPLIVLRGRHVLQPCTCTCISIFSHEQIDAYFEVQPIHTCTRVHCCTVVHCQSKKLSILVTYNIIIIVHVLLVDRWRTTVFVNSDLTNASTSSSTTIRGW